MSVSARPAKLIIASAGRQTVILTFRPRRTGVYRGQLQLRTDDPARPTIVVAFRGTGR